MTLSRSITPVDSLKSNTDPSQVTHLKIPGTELTLNNFSISNRLGFTTMTISAFKTICLCYMKKFVKRLAR